MSLSLRFWGTRGSIPSPGPLTARYGGNTPCLEVRGADGRLIILDAGSGIRGLGRWLIDSSGGPISADIVLTHGHWDHIQGIPFFAPLFVPGNKIRIWGSDALERPIDVKFGPDGAMYILDFGKVDIHNGHEQIGQRTGQVFRVYPAGSPSTQPSMPPVRPAPPRNDDD